MNEVRFIQKIGQVPMSELVENAAKQGFVLVGSPTAVAGTPAQLMIHTGAACSEPEYKIVQKTGQLRIEHQIADMLREGWQIYGSMLAGEVPMQAMVRGDIGVHTMYGISQPPSGDIPLTGDWQKEIARIDESLTEIYAVLNSMPSKDEEIAQLWQYVDTKHDEGMSAMRGEVAGCNSYTDMEVARIDAAYTVAINLQVKKNAEQDMALDTLGKRTKDTDRRLDEIIAEQDQVNIALKKDIEALNERLDQMSRIMSHLVDQPAS